ncbi:hypothetical protein TNCV_1288061 [Trichonephila clavipes]|nr:hypothetical protein TNCV_1288061 [Trichonephila clavipes]
MDGDHLLQSTGLDEYPTDDVVSQYWEARRQMVKKPSPRRKCTMRYDQALMHTSSVRCLETFRSMLAVTLPLVRSNSWGAQLAVPNDSR